jgi:phthalate 4,5-dioxygenase oxygenase subunit
MITAEQNRALTCVGSGTSMGEYMRRFWLPALASEDLPDPSTPPRKIRLLGEDLVMFRAEDGRVGLLADRCPHRGAKLSLGRNEPDGLRCVYHGWLMDVAGRPVETPNARGLVHADPCGYPTIERGGLIWAYLGPPSTVPPKPELPWEADDLDRLILRVVIRCNWLQCLEGTMDPAHSNYLHRDEYRTRATLSSVGEREIVEDGIRYWPTDDASPHLEVEDRPGGFCLRIARRTVERADELEYRRVQVYVAPSVALASQPDCTVASISIPMDDETTMFYALRWSSDGPIDADDIRRRMGVVEGVGIDADGLRERTPDNNWLQDRDAVARGESYWGIPGAIEQDAVIWESLGPIHDRTRENVCGPDLGIVHLRRSLLQAMDDLAAGREPPGDRVTPFPGLGGQQPLGGPWVVAALV